MTRPVSRLNWQSLGSPVRRVLAVDGGSRRLKLLLVQSDFGRLRLLREEMLDLQVEGLVAPEELKSHLQATLDNCGRPPTALALPQHLSISQVVDLPLAQETEVDKLIADETLKLSGVSESRIVYDFVRIETAATNRQQFWVTLCQEVDIRERILRLGIDGGDLCDVTTSANALIAAFRATAPLCSRAILVHLGAQSTVLVIVLEGQGAFAASFPMGGDFFTRALARLQNTSEEAAETLKREHNFLSGPETSAEFAGVVDGWAAELKRQLNEWFQQNPALISQVASFELIASGGAFKQPGLVAYLKTNAALDLKPWPKAAQAGAVQPSKGFEIAFGTALQALGHSPQPVSLLPEDYRQAWRKRLSRRRFELGSLALLALSVLLLALGTWHKFSLIGAKNLLLEKVREAQTALDANDSLTSDVVLEYENLRPIFAEQQNTIDTLKTISLLQESRSNRNFWYVLLADEQTYFSRPPAMLSTNRPVNTNLLGGTIDPSRPGLFPFRTAPAVFTNVVAAKPGIIAELCVPGEPEAARQVLSELVNGLKHQRLFSKVDLLSDDLRRNIADPKVIVPDRHFVLALDFAETDFEQPVRLKKPPAAPVRAPPRRAARPSSPTEMGDYLP